MYGGVTDNEEGAARGRAAPDSSMDNIANQAARIMTAVRAARPLIHQITNFVVMNETANITLCAGGRPVMAHAREEVEEMAAAANALVLNLGTLWPEQVESMLKAGRKANACGTPVVLDPVGAGATRFRTESALRVAESVKVSILRGNFAEIATLAGFKADIRGVDSVDASNEAAEVAVACAKKFGCTTAITGAVDIVTNGQWMARIRNGDKLMSRVTGTGCMATAVIGCYAAVEKEWPLAATAALAVYGLAGEIAAEGSPGPGTFMVRLYDAVAQLNAEQVMNRTRIEIAA